MTARFWNRIVKNESGCWEWVGTTNKNGYGKLSIKGKLAQAHRFSYSLHKGPIPEGLFVLHKCDNKKCVNPEHLELGTKKKNVEDASTRGLMPKGGIHHNAKLNEYQVMEIIRSTDSLKALSQRYGVSISLISHIRTRRQWKHILT